MNIFLGEVFCASRLDSGLGFELLKSRSRVQIQHSQQVLTALFIGIIIFIPLECPKESKGIIMNHNL